MEGHTAVVKVLVAAGADVNAVDKVAHHHNNILLHIIG